MAEMSENRWSDVITTSDGDYVGVDEADAEVSRLRADRDALLAKCVGNDADILKANILAGKMTDECVALRADNGRLREEYKDLSKLSARDEHKWFIKELEFERKISRLLEALVEEMAARLWADDIFRLEDHLTWSEIDERMREVHRKEARAALGSDDKRLLDCPDCGDRDCSEITCPHHSTSMEADEGAGQA